MYIEERNASGDLHGFNAYQLSKTDENAPPLGYVYASDVQLSHNKDEQVFDFQLNHAYGEIYNKDGELQMFYAEKFEPWVLTYPLTRRSMKPNTLANDEIDEILKNPPPEIDLEKLPLYAFERDRRLAFSLAPLALAFVGIPLGMNSRRKETSSGLTMSLIIAFAYFLVLILAEETRSSNLALSQVLLWLPNVLGVTLGLWLMRRASRHG